MQRTRTSLAALALIALPALAGAAGRADYPHNFSFVNDGDVVIMTVEGNGMDGNGNVHFPTLAGVPHWGSGSDLVEKFGPLNHAEDNWPK
jgi:hypothetical protein